MNKGTIFNQFENPGHLLSWAKNFDRPELVEELDKLLTNADWQSRPGPFVKGIRMWDKTSGLNETGPVNWGRILEILSTLEGSS